MPEIKHVREARSEGPAVYDAVKDLALACTLHFLAFRKTKRIGFGMGSCCAATRIQDGPYRFGSSRAYILDYSQTDKKRHAEISLLKAVGGRSVDGHIYVDLEPCNGGYKGFNCVRDLSGLQGVSVWYLCESPKEMHALHRRTSRKTIEAFVCKKMGARPTQNEVNGYPERDFNEIRSGNKRRKVR